MMANFGACIPAGLQRHIRHHTEVLWISAPIDGEENLLAICNCKALDTFRFESAGRAQSQEVLLCLRAQLQPTFWSQKGRPRLVSTQHCRKRDRRIVRQRESQLLLLSPPSFATYHLVIIRFCTSEAIASNGTAPSCPVRFVCCSALQSLLYQGAFWQIILLRPCLEVPPPFSSCTSCKSRCSHRGCQSFRNG